MDYIDGIHNAITYVENHLTEQIDYNAIAKCACSSSFNFQRIFYAVCGITIGEYARNRRMSEAGTELANGAKVIDVALRYGYDTPESFSRAFAKFHGVTPQQVKRGAPHKIYSPLSIKLTISGGRTMNYEIRQMESFDVLVKTKRFSKNKEINNKEIIQFWAQCVQDGTVERLVSHVHPNNVFDKSMIGIALEYKDDENDFPYGIGVHYDGKPVSETDFQTVTIPANTYVVFPIDGRMPEVFHGVYQYLFCEFFPNSEYYPTGIEIEAYPSDDTANPNYHWELWFSVAKK